MEEKNSTEKESLLIFEEVEIELEKLFSKRKEEIEKELEAKIRREKEEAEKKLNVVHQEFTRGRELLTEYRSIITAFESERAQLRNQLREHFSRAIQYQTEIEKMAGMTLEELNQVSDLNKKLETLEQAAEEKIGFMRKNLEERFGIVAELPETEEGEEIKVDLEQELKRLKKIKELLEAETAKVQEVKHKPEPEPKAEINPIEEAVIPEVTPENHVPVNIPEINEVMEKTLAADEIVKPVAEVPAPQPRPKTKPAAAEDSFKDIYERLEKYRKVNAEGNNGEICFFQKDNKVILDGESLISAMSETLEEAGRLYLRLSQSESPKEHFFIKQEIINHQEILRKLILRVVKLCEKEGYSLPRYTEGVLNIELLKSILERLSIGNWSNEADFNAFKVYSESLKDAYYARITPPVVYLKSVVEELGV